MDDALNAWMLQLIRYHAMRLWLGGGPWEVEWRTRSCGGVKLQSAPSHVLVSCQTPPTDRCYPRLITHYGCNCPTMNSPSQTDGLGRVYSLDCFSKSWLITDAVLIRQRIQCACSLLNDATPARPTDPSHVASGLPLPSPHQWTYSGYQLDSQLACRSPESGFAYRPSLNNRRSSVQLFIALHCLKFLTARNSMLDTEKFFRVSSLASLINIHTLNPNPNP